MNWQPIETAPKDGSKVLMWRDGLIQTAWWRADILGGQSCFGGNGWSYAGFAMPTHWMPLPDPPA